LPHNELLFTPEHESTRDEDDSLVTSYVFHQQNQSVQQYSGLQKVGKEEDADLGRHGRTRCVITYKRWMSAGRRPSLWSQGVDTGDRSSLSVPASSGNRRT